MTTSSTAKWIIKNKDGFVKGPYSTDQVLKMIGQGELTGNEQIALYPGADWHPISQDAQFYDKLLESLEGEQMRPRDSFADQHDASLLSTPTPGSVSEKTRNRAEKIQSNQPPHQDSPPKEKAHKEQKRKEKSDTLKETEPPVIELKKKKKVLKKAKAKKSLVPAILIAAAIAGAAYYYLNDAPASENRVRLLAVRAGGTERPREEIQSKLKEGLQHFVRDDFAGYRAAQNSFVQAFEGDNHNAAALGFLCLTYYQLWPFSYQDSQDLHTILLANQLVSKIDPASLDAATCRVVDLMIRGRYVEAKSVVDTALDTHSQGEAAPVTLYYLKANLLEMNRELESAVSYIRSAQQYFKQWLRLFVYEAALLSKLNRHEEAAKRYRQVLEVNASHAASLFELGMIEHYHFKNTAQAETLLRLGFSSSDQARRDIVSRAYLTLAEIRIARGDARQGLAYAQKAYTLNSTNERAKNIILELGGEAKLRETKILDVQLVYEGDQLKREGDCSSAQAHYKAAFEVNPKNGLAAMKAAECLWAVSLTSDAIDWLNKAIRADPNLIDAYIMQADFFSRRYDFVAAAQILSRANQVRPNHYKVFRGLAQVELRRLNAKGAVTNAQRALQYYDADVESYVILAQAQLMLREFSHAFSSASKAVEIDINHRQAQIVYAEALGAVQGLPAGIDHLKRLISLYPMISEYRLALGDLYFKDQNYSAAESIYEQVTRIDLKPKEAYLKLGRSQQAQSKYDLALDSYLRSAEIDPSDPEALVQAGLLYLEIKKPTEAQAQFRRVMRINRDYPLINYYMGRAALMNRSPEEAIKAANEEKARNPNLADPYLLAADAYVELEQYTLCASEYQQAVKLRPQGALIYIKMARCFRLSGNLDAAVSMINTAAAQESGEPEVWKERGQIYEIRNDAVKAIESYNQYLVLAPNAADRKQIEMRIQALSR